MEPSNNTFQSKNLGNGIWTKTHTIFYRLVDKNSVTKKRNVTARMNPCRAAILSQNKARVDDQSHAKKKKSDIYPEVRYLNFLIRNPFFILLKYTFTNNISY